MIGDVPNPRKNGDPTPEETDRIVGFELGADDYVVKPFSPREVVLRVTFTAAGHVVVQSVVRGLGHGLDEEATREAQQIRFHPATRNGLPVDATTTVTIKFQLA